jgi:small-conductance mechanosensitive channel
VGWWWGVSTWIRGLQERILRRRKDWLKGYTIRNYTLLKPHQQYRLIKTALLSVKWSLFLAGLFIGLPYVFSLYPSTRPIARQVVEWTTVPLVTIGGKILDYLPNLFTITLLIIILRAVLQLVAYFSREVQSEALKLKGFHADWARPTFLIFRAIWLLFGLTVIFPYLPGANSAAFQGVSVFLGVLLSLGSSAAISNLVAGLVMIYMRSFEPGDRIRTGDLEGIVLEKSLLVTRLRTFLNEEITIPNQALLNGHITNYSRSARECGLWIQTEVTIGYDVPWQQVHELLVRAALQTADIEREPVPFVVQTALNDFYVAYRVHARTRQTGFLVELHSRLHATIQDVFFAAGVEICSPHFHAFRDGNGVQMPPEFRPGASIRNNTQGYSPQNPQSGKGSAD